MNVSSSCAAPLEIRRLRLTPKTRGAAAPLAARPPPPPPLSLAGALRPLRLDTAALGLAGQMRLARPIFNLLPTLALGGRCSLFSPSQLFAKVFWKVSGDRLIENKPSNLLPQKRIRGDYKKICEEIYIIIFCACSPAVPSRVFFKKNLFCGFSHKNGKLNQEPTPLTWNKRCDER